MALTQQQIDESRRLIAQSAALDQQASQRSGVSYFQNGTPLSTPIKTNYAQAPINSAMLDSSAPTIKPVVPKIPPVEDIAEFAEDSVAQGPMATKADEYISRLTSINDQVSNPQTGISAYTSQQEIAAGIPELESFESDLGGQLQGLLRQSQALDIQAQTLPSRIQEQFKGTGATLGGVAPIEAGELRKIQMQKGALASDALLVQANLDSVQGRLVSAGKKVERAVNQKFGPLLAEQEAKLKNLELILKSPAYSEEQKQRAEARKLIEEAKKEKLELAKAEQKEIWDLANKIAPQLAKTPQGAVILDQIQNAGSKEEALAIALPYLQQAQGQGPASVQEYEYAKSQGYTGSFTDYQNEDANRKISIARAGVSGVTTNGIIPQPTVSSVTGKPLTQEERLSQGYANRAVQSDATIDEIGAQFTGVSSYVGKILPNFLKSSDRQRFEQAQKNFVNAILRRESGAAIAESEFQNARQQYFPQPGDAPAVIEQKNQNRELVIRALQLAGGIQIDNDPLGLR